ncbi:hypothetical protein [Archangium sp.]|uniref:hypothetical protein n=1 Tax=Archangium sp. TaxID=1872627 RepID=UPI0038998537
MQTQKMMAVPGIKAMLVPGAASPLDDLTLDEIKDLMNNLVSQGSTFQYQLGVMYNHVVNRKLAELAGYKSAQVYFNQHVKALSQSTLSTYGAVARNFDGDTCTQYGVYHLRALLRYLDATGATAPADPGPVSIDVPQDDSKVVTKPFAECSVDDVESATRAKRAPAPSWVPVPDKARLLFFEDSLYQNFKGVAEVRFTANNQEGTTLINLQGVPMAEVPRLIQALQQGLQAQPSLAAK